MDKTKSKQKIVRSVAALGGALLAAASAQGQPLASAIFGDYSSTVYLTPILGGLIADRWLGRRITLILGGLIMALGGGLSMTARASARRSAAQPVGALVAA